MSRRVSRAQLAQLFRLGFPAALQISIEVVAFALAGRVDLDLSKEAIGTGRDGKEVFLKEIWPSVAELKALMQSSFSAETFRKLYTDYEQNQSCDRLHRNRDIQSCTRFVEIAIT